MLVRASSTTTSVVWEVRLNTNTGTGTGYWIALIGIGEGALGTFTITPCPPSAPSSQQDSEPDSGGNPEDGYFDDL
jgi:hypothetical protein